MRLIDAHILMEELQKGTANAIKPDFQKGLLEAQRIVINSPTVCEMYGDIPEFNERPTGEWYYSCQSGWHCSICQQIVKDMPTVMGKAHFDYCPNCGAKMKQEVENDSRTNFDRDI